MVLGIPQIPISITTRDKGGHFGIVINMRSADGFWRNLQDCKPSALFGVGGISIFGTESTSVLWSTSNFKESSGKEPAATLLGTHLVLHIAE